MKHIQVTDNLDKLLASIQRLQGQQVLVGVPDERTDRTDADAASQTPITNATIAYVQDNGSPEQNIPARPFMGPGIEAAKDRIASGLGKAAFLTLDGQDPEAGLTRVGQVAADGIKNAIRNGAFVPLKPSTIRRRYLQRETKGMRKNEKLYLELLRKNQDVGMSDQASAAAAQSAANIKPLINTSQLLRSISYVLRKTG